MICRTVCEGALRKIGRLGAGRAARLPDLEDTFVALMGLYRSLVSSGAFGRLRDVTPKGDYTARENERVFRAYDTTQEILLPEFVPNWCGDPCEYGSRWIPPANDVTNRNMRVPRDCSVVVIIDSFTGQMGDFVYNGQIKQWQALNQDRDAHYPNGLKPMTLDDEAPLSFGDPTGLQAALAVEISDLFGVDIPAVTGSQAVRFTTSLTHRFSMPRRTVPGVFV